ncbi:MAG TPA: DUF447 domain-containing protein [Methylibium sp.]|uniref:DUF447 domain-containing protein n=1 Tax=Methylibium sp. TaxID=2067992 RepID=UPI002DBB83F3|nr:DUF447 domain-containing protein [Methylibium sp.]HEU4459801.1 DUF447 domain-containing protein [Methylibium sp.]
MANEVIFEAVITTLDADGAVHVAPFGVRYDGRQVVLKPFKPSATLEHIRARGHAVLNLTTDTRVFASAVCARWLGEKRWPDEALELVATRFVPGLRLGGPLALAHSELRLAADDDDAERPTLRLDRVHDATHAPFPGFNRAQAAVLEAAVLVSRLQMLSADKIDAELRYLQIAIDKTASAADHEAWGWLNEAVARQRAQREAAR